MIVGIEHVEERLDKFANLELKKGVSQAIAEVQNAAKSLCPVHSGELRQSIYTDIEYEANICRGICYTNNVYAAFVEFGTGPNGQASHDGHTLISEYIDELYPIAMDFGITPERFWEYSLQEVIDLLQSAKRTKAQAFKEKIFSESRIARMVAEDMYYMLNGKGKIVWPWDIYPDLFKEEQEVYEKQMEERKFEEFKQQRKMYVERMNARTKGAADE